MCIEFTQSFAQSSQKRQEQSGLALIPNRVLFLICPILNLVRMMLACLAQPFLATSMKDVRPNAESERRSHP